MMHATVKFLKCRWLIFQNIAHFSTSKNPKGPVKLIKPGKIAHSFLQSVSDQFQVIILSLPM